MTAVQDPPQPALVDLDLTIRPADIRPRLLALADEHETVRVSWAGGEPWIICDADLAAQAFLDQRLSKDPSVRAGWFVDIFGLIGGPQVDVPVMLMSEGDAHARMRKLHLTVFGPRRIPRWQEFVEESLGELWAAMPTGDGPVDLVERLAYPLPVRVISAMLGLPADLAEVALQACHDIGSGPDAATRGRGARNLFGTVHDLIHHRRAELPDGMIADLLALAETDGSITHREVVVWMAGLFLPGHESTASVITSMFWEVLRTPVDRRPDLEQVDDVVEETLRTHPPFPLATWRFAATDVPIGRHVIPAGTPVLINIPAANAARGASRHLSFGQGIHLCVGATLARLEARAALTSLLTRFPHAELVDPEVTWVSGEALRRITALPVRLTGR